MIRKFLLASFLFTLISQSQFAHAQSSFDKFKQKMDDLKPSGKLLRQILGQDEEPEAKKTEAKPTAVNRTPTPAQRPQPSPTPLQRPQPPSTFRGQPPLANYQPSLAETKQDRARSTNELGVIIEETTQGLTIALVRPGSPADKAGIQVNDRIAKFAGLAIASEEELDGIAGALRDGDQIEVNLIRNGKPHDVVVTLGTDESQQENKENAETAEKSVNPAASSGSDFQPPAESAQRELEALRQTVKDQQQMIRELQERLRAVQASQFRGR